MANIRKRWGIIKSYIGWEDYLGFVILLIGVLGFFNGPIPYIPGLTDAYHKINGELLGIGITVLIIDNANDAIKRREEKKWLILQMGNPDNAVAIEAVRQLRTRGWLFDGALHGANLSDATLIMADLINADLRVANLSNANLWGAEVKPEQLERANSIENATMPDGTKHE